MNDMAITTTSNNLDVSAALDKRTNSNVSPSQRIEQVSVSVIDEFDYNKLPGNEVDSTPFIEAILTFILISIGALAFMSYTLSLSFDPPQVQQQIQQTK